MDFTTLSSDELGSLQAQLQTRYEGFVAENLALDLTRGKPAAEQLDLSNELDGILGGFFLLQDGTDVRNYGGLLGIPEARALGAALLGTQPAETMAAGNSSLSLMYAYVDFMLRGPWASSSPVKFLCPVPGYDRHFTICEHFGIEMINVPLLDGGPDMDMIEQLVQGDSAIKGIWCVPKYSNPTGHTYSAETVERMAQLALHAGADFRIMWDNAYAVHHLTETPDSLENLMTAAHKADTADSVVMLASTSKITFAGAGVAFLGTSKANLTAFEKFLSASVIGFDKVNQLRHVRFLPDLPAITAHMEKHRDIIKPRFDIVLDALATQLGDKGIATWTRPNGGYFISLDTLPGLASNVVKLAAEAGVKLTPAGATFPYGKDPADTNIRIAPTFPSTSQLQKAVEVLIVCIQLASATMLLAR